MEQNLTNIKQQKEELEQRIYTVHQQQPSLVRLEELQSRIEQFRLEKAGLEGEINALRSQIKTLTEQKQKPVTQIVSQNVDLLTKLKVKKEQVSFAEVIS